MKKFSIISLISFALIGASSAMTLSISRGGAGNGIIAQSTSALLTTGGYYIGVGTFASVPTITDGASLAAAVTSFLEFGSALAPNTGGTIGTIAATISGSGTVTGPPAASATDFNGKPIYFVIGNGTNRTNSTEFAIFTLNAGATATTTFDPNVAGSATNNITLATVGSINVLSGAGSVVDNTNPTQDRLMLVSTVVVPEPASFVLLSFLGLIGLRRKR